MDKPKFIAKIQVYFVYIPYNEILPIGLLRNGSKAQVQAHQVVYLYGLFKQG